MSGVENPVERHVYRQMNPRGGSNPPFYNGRTGEIGWTLFLPNKCDTSGLSFIWKHLRSELWAAYRPERVDVRFMLIRLNASALDSEEPKLISRGYRNSPDSLDDRFGEPWAHCELLSVNRTDYDADINKAALIQGWAKRVAAKITPSQISGPFPKPTAADEASYRP